MIEYCPWYYECDSGKLYKRQKNRIQAIRAKNKKLRETAEDVYDWAILNDIKMSSRGVWTRLKQSLGEKK